ncbi:hypothetical protein [Burkholderia ubonensis]|uniref:hypothetical protein n=1 Tax=Burkholderia ubonensis TaxID=101571 RepID=UPI001E29B7D2|nr:hypothetical protein [Burkholderia ubonensis]
MKLDAFVAGGFGGLLTRIALIGKRHLYRLARGVLNLSSECAPARLRASFAQVTFAIWRNGATTETIFPRNFLNSHHCHNIAHQHKVVKLFSRPCKIQFAQRMVV